MVVPALDALLDASSAESARALFERACAVLAGQHWESPGRHCTGSMSSRYALRRFAILTGYDPALSSSKKEKRRIVSARERVGIARSEAHEPIIFRHRWTPTL